MPAANPLGGTATLGSGVRGGASPVVQGNANISVAALVGVSLLVLVGFHLLGFRFAFDVSVGRR